MVVAMVYGLLFHDAQLPPRRDGGSAAVDRDDTQRTAAVLPWYRFTREIGSQEGGPSFAGSL